VNQKAFSSRPLFYSTAAVALLAMVVVASPAQAQETGTLRMTFKLKGDKKMQQRADVIAYLATNGPAE
jgi:hypothetical protein